MAVNSIGPMPERAPAAPAAFMQQFDPGPGSGTGGIFSTLLNAGMSGYDTWAGLQAPNPGSIGGRSGGSNFSGNLGKVNSTPNAFTMDAIKF
jgi:hypothetical protein